MRMPSPIWMTISGMARRPVSSERIGASTAAMAISTRVATAEVVTSRHPTAVRTSPHPRRQPRAGKGSRLRAGPGGLGQTRVHVRRSWSGRAEGADRDRSPGRAGPLPSGIRSARSGRRWTASTTSTSTATCSSCRPRPPPWRSWPECTPPTTSTTCERFCAAGGGALDADTYATAASWDAGPAGRRSRPGGHRRLWPSGVGSGLRGRPAHPATMPWPTGPWASACSTTWPWRPPPWWPGASGC